MKKLIAMLLTVALVCALAACGSAPAEPQEETEPAETTEAAETAEVTEKNMSPEDAKYQIEVAMQHLLEEAYGDKVTDAEKAPVNEAIAKLRETLKGSDVAAIKADTEALQKAFYPLAEKIYQQAQAQQGADTNANAGQNGTDANGNYYSNDFEDKT